MACRQHLLVALVAACFLPSLVSAGVSFASLGNASIAITGVQYFPSTGATAPLINQTVSVDEYIRVNWTALPAATTRGLLPRFRKAHVKLCYGPASTVNRGWRKAIDDIELDRQCHKKIIDVPWQNGFAVYKLSENIPGAFYRLRIYAIDESGDPIAFGQNTVQQLFYVIPISGRSTGLDVAIGVLSAVSGLTLAGYFLREQMIKKKAAAGK